MCLLTYLPEGVLPDTHALRTGTLHHPDGHGFAIVTDGALLTQHGLDADHMVGCFHTLRQRHPDGPALFHSRWATHGAHDLGNCHPFPVGGDAGTVLAHNGVLPKRARPTTTDPRSDTRIAAEEILPRFGSLRQQRVRRAVERWMGPDNLMVVLTIDPGFRRPGYILNEAKGIWDQGIWYSNGSYRMPAEPDTEPVGGETAWVDWGTAPGWGCPICTEPLRWWMSQCPRCGWCLDCGDATGDCQRHPRRRARTKAWSHLA